MTRRRRCSSALSVSRFVSRSRCVPLAGGDRSSAPAAPPRQTRAALPGPGAPSGNLRTAGRSRGPPGCEGNGRRGALGGRAACGGTTRRMAQRVTVDRRRARGERGGVAARRARASRSTSVEMKPARRSPAHVLDGFAELVCSNSLRSDNPQNAVGPPARGAAPRSGASCSPRADATRVPAGDALAVDRERFSALVTGASRGHPLVTLRRRSEALRSPRARSSRSSRPGRSPPTRSRREIARASPAARLHFYDAIAPIVAADSIDPTIAYAQSRYGKGSGDDYLNLPFDERAVPRVRRRARSRARRWRRTTSRSRATSRAACRSR